MSNTLKCIGGDADGNVVSLRAGEYVYVCRKLKLSAVPSFRPATPVAVNYEETLYEVDRIYCGDQSIDFLRPIKWSSEQALRYALGAR